jgi:hypothetical protein
MNMFSDEQLRSVFDLNMGCEETPITNKMRGLRAVEDAVRADVLRAKIGCDHAE